MATQAGEETDEEIEAVRSEPLRTREVFLDTEIYKRHAFDPENPSLVSLKNRVGEDRLRLHMADITWREIERQLTDQAREAIDQIQKARITLAKWQQRAPEALGGFRATKLLNPEAVAKEAIGTFRSRLPLFTSHTALQQPAVEIFEAYFARSAPFDGRGGKSVKEFPDAFVLSVLEAWCIANGTKMYVVTADKAMQRAAAATRTLIPLRTLDELLQSVTLEHSPEVQQRVEEVIETLHLSEQLGEAIDRHLEDVGLIYAGELYDGEATGAARSGVAHIADWTVISAEDGRFGLILGVVVDLLVDVHFEDLSMASYDNEDGIYVGAEPSDTEVQRGRGRVADIRGGPRRRKNAEDRDANRRYRSKWRCRLVQMMMKLRPSRPANRGSRGDRPKGRPRGLLDWPMSDRAGFATPADIDASGRLVPLCRPQEQQDERASTRTFRA